jgi:putative ABC transport system permease protein
VFDRTFAITGVLRLLAMLIAFVGIVGALLAMMLERAREFAILRANGMLPSESGRLIAVHTGLLGRAAGVAAIPTGLMLAAVLVYVINHRVFGWTMGFQVEAMMLLQAVVVAVLAELLAAAWPIWRLTRLPPAVALRQE